MRVIIERHKYRGGDLRSVQRAAKALLKLGCLRAFGVWLPPALFAVAQGSSCSSRKVCGCCCANSDVQLGWCALAPKMPYAYAVPSYFAAMMYRSLFLGLLACIVWNCAAQNEERTMLWKVRPADGGAPSYVVGTMHSRDARVFVHTPLMLEALARVKGYAGELDMAAMDLQADQLMKMMMMPDGKALADLYSKKQYRTVQEGLKDRLGIAALFATRMRPMAISMLLTEQANRSDSTVVLDAWLQARATDAGLTIRALEKVEDQLDLFQGLELKEEARMLYKQIKANEDHVRLERMVLCYAAADLPKLLKEVDSYDIGTSMRTAMLDDRNAGMHFRMDSLVQAEGPFLFAVGAAHLPGPSGVLAGLRGRGYAVTPVLRREDL